MRSELLLNSGWKFHKGDIKVETPLIKEPIYYQSKTERKKAGPAAYGYLNGLDHFWTSGKVLSEKWADIDLPHDYIIDQDLTNEGTNQALGYLKYSNAWYRKSFTLPSEYIDKRITLRFDGIAGKSTIYLNGCLMYHNFSSYNTFEIDITDRVFFDKENRIAVYVNTEEFEGWWYQGGGIYRNVWLTVTDPVAIDLWGVYAPYEKINDTDFKINFESSVVNAGFEDRKFTGDSFVIDKDTEYDFWYLGSATDKASGHLSGMFWGIDKVPDVENTQDRNNVPQGDAVKIMDSVGATNSIPVFWQKLGTSELLSGIHEIAFSWIFRSIKADFTTWADCVLVIPSEWGWTPPTDASGDILPDYSIAWLDAMHIKEKYFSEDYSAIVEDIELPINDLKTPYGSGITFESENNGVISNEGIITRPYFNQDNVSSNFNIKANNAGKISSLKIPVTIIKLPK